MQLRPVNLDQDYDMLAALWRERQMEPPEQRFLSPLGAIIELSGKPVAAAFLISTDANTWVLGNFITNPAFDRAARFEALTHLAWHLEAVAKSRAAQVLTFCTNVASLGDLVESLGFTKMETGLSIYVKEVV